LLALWWVRIELRERLGGMPERLLADIGLDHAAVAREARRPFWRPVGEGLGASAPTFQAVAPSRAPAALPAVLQPVLRLPGATFPILS
jgi:hypothetical protein